MRWIGAERVQVLLVLILGLFLRFSPDNYAGVLARAFLMPWAVVFALLALLALLRRRVWLCASAVLALLLVLMVQRTRTGPMVPVASGAPVLRVAQMNLLQPNDRHEAVLAAARSTGADVISLQEVNARWAPVLVKGLGAQYPYSRIVPQEDCYGIALFSKLPLDRPYVLHLAHRPAISVLVRTPQGTVRLLAVHATSPGSYREFRDREFQLERLAQVVAASDTPTVVIGDLNTVDWDSAFRRLCSKADLHECADGPSATWPSVARMAMVPLDHVLVTPTLRVLSKSTFFIPGSDHRGLLAELTLGRP